jgi:hypothetical protein
VVTHGVPWTKGLEVETGCVVAALKQVRAQLAQPRLYRTDLTVHPVLVEIIEAVPEGTSPSSDLHPYDHTIASQLDT